MKRITVSYQSNHGRVVLLASSPSHAAKLAEMLMIVGTTDIDISSVAEVK